MPVGKPSREENDSISLVAVVLALPMTKKLILEEAQ